MKFRGIKILQTSVVEPHIVNFLNIEKLTGFFYLKSSIKIERVYFVLIKTNQTSNKSCIKQTGCTLLNL